MQIEPSAVAPVQAKKLIKYQVIDNQTGKVIKEYRPDQRVFASRMVDKLDNEYGGYKYSRKPIYENDTKSEKFIAFLESLKNPENADFIETAKAGFLTINEI